MSRRGKKTEYKGITFDSQSECEFYQLLELKKKQKKIKDFVYEPEYMLQEGGWHNARNDKQEAIMYYPDFLVTANDGERLLIDVKGHDAEETAKLKKKMLEYQNRDIVLYFISKTPQYLSSEWVEMTPYRDMLLKLKSAYKKEYPTVKTRGKNSPQLTVKCWEKYMEIRMVHGLFYTFEKVFTKKELEKMSK